MSMLKKQAPAVSTFTTVLASQVLNKQPIITVCLFQLKFVLTVLKLHIGNQFAMLTAISGIDLLQSKYRFCVAYELLSLTYNTRLRVKVFCDLITPVLSSTSVFSSANWWEREIWDMFGIYFSQHLDLRRLLTDYGFEGYPLRKDFPTSGFVEVRYDEAYKKIVIEPLSLAQEYRVFHFEMPW
jgi:NADH:ubiquinone oxidoreductase subunit C